MINPSLSLLYWLIPWIVFLFVNRVFVVSEQKSFFMVMRDALVQSSLSHDQPDEAL